MTAKKAADKPPKEKQAAKKSKPVTKKAASGKKLGRDELHALFKLLSGGRSQISPESLQRASRRLGIQDLGEEDCIDLLALFGSTDRPTLNVDEFDELCTEHMKVN